MSIWFTSDTHFGHARIVELCERPFRDVREMDEELVRRWNARVAPGDVVYHLGDFSMGPRRTIGEVLRQLRGYKVLVRGNHDRSRTAMLAEGFDEVFPALEVEVAPPEGEPDFVPGRTALTVYMRHHPEERFFDPATWWRWCDNRIHLCGHVHEKWRRRGDAINVGVDQWGFEPKSLRELLAGVAGTRETGPGGDR